MSDTPSVFEAKPGLTSLFSFFPSIFLSFILPFPFSSSFLSLFHFLFSFPFSFAFPFVPFINSYISFLFPFTYLLFFFPVSSFFILFSSFSFWHQPHPLTTPTPSDNSWENTVQYLYFCSCNEWLLKWPSYYHCTYLSPLPVTLLPLPLPLFLYY